MRERERATLAHPIPCIRQTHGCAHPRTHSVREQTLHNYSLRSISKRTNTKVQILDLIEFKIKLELEKVIFRINHHPS